MLVTYFGKKTAYYNNRSYFPGEVFEAPDRITRRDGHGQPLLDDQGKEVTVPLQVYPEKRFSKLRKATKEEVDDYVRRNPRYQRRQEAEGLIEQREQRAVTDRGGKRKPVTVGASE